MDITRESLMKMDWKTIAAALKDPKTQPKVIQLMRGDRELNVHISQLLAARAEAQGTQEQEVDRQTAIANPPSTEELAAEAAAVAAQPPAAPVAETPVVVEPPAAPAQPAQKTKIVREYQVRDEDGNPIGRPTHLEAYSMEEMLDKMQVAHENATRAFHRLKKQKVTFTKQEALTPEQIKAAAAKALEGKDVAEAEKLVRATLETEFKAKDEEFLKREATLREQALFAEGQKIGMAFIRKHLHDFNPVEANLRALGEFVIAHDMEYTVDSLEVAFLDLQAQGDKLAPVTKVAAAPKPAEAAPITQPTATVEAAKAAELPPTPPAAPVKETVVAPPAAVSQPTVEAMVATSAAPQSAPAARRPGVNGTIPPGTMSANRPGVVDPALARKEFMKELKAMDPKVMRTKLAMDPQFVAKLKSYGIQVK